MFEVYRQDGERLEWLAECETATRARVLAIKFSLPTGTKVLVLENLANGETVHRYTFESGQPSATGGFRRPPTE